MRGAFNAVFVEGDTCGELMLYGRGAGGPPTASAVLGDVIDAAHHLRSGAAARVVPRAGPDPAHRRPALRLVPEHRRRSTVPVCWPPWPSVFGDHGVSIRSMEQVGLGDEARLIFLTHVARDGRRDGAPSTGCATSTSSTTSAGCCASWATRRTA